MTMFNTIKKNAERDLKKAKGEKKEAIVNMFKAECIACKADNKSIIGTYKVAGRWVCTPHKIQVDKKIKQLKQEQNETKND